MAKRPKRIDRTEVYEGGKKVGRKTSNGGVGGVETFSLWEKAGSGLALQGANERSGFRVRNPSWLHVTGEGLLLGIETIAAGFQLPSFVTGKGGGGAGLAQLAPSQPRGRMMSATRADNTRQHQRGRVS